MLRYAFETLSLQSVYLLIEKEHALAIKVNDSNDFSIVLEKYNEYLMRITSSYWEGKMTDDLSKTAKHWGKNEPPKEQFCFYNSPILRAHFIKNAYGENYIAEYKNNANFQEDLFVDRYMQGKENISILSLCCGFGSIERRFLSRISCVECTGVDLSEGALAIARVRATEAGFSQVTYECANLNDYDWKEEKYDLVIANGALHHLSHLEKVFAGIKHTLKPNGLLYACEYVGPSYQNHGTRQLELINACSFLVPSELRGRRALPLNISNDLLFKYLSGGYLAANRVNTPQSWPNWKKKIAAVLKRILSVKKDAFNFGVIYRSQKTYWMRKDPSEGVRSADIVSVAKTFFPDIEVRPFGGAILQYALDVNFYTLFDENNSKHVACLNLLCSIEDELIKNGEIGVENAYLIAQK